MTWTALEPDALAQARRGRAAWLRDRLDAMPRIDLDDYDASRAHVAAARDALRADLAQITDPPAIRENVQTGAAVRMLGIRCTATSGLEAALRNWIARVEREHGR